MIKVYIRAILSGKKVLSDVPSYWRNGVLAELDRMLADEEITQEEYNEFIK